MAHKFIGFRDGPKAYKFIRFGDIHSPNACQFIRFGNIHGSKAYNFIRFGDIHGHKGFNRGLLGLYKGLHRVNKTLLGPIRALIGPSEGPIYGVRPFGGFPGAPGLTRARIKKHKIQYLLLQKRPPSPATTVFCQGSSFSTPRP